MKGRNVMVVGFMMILFVLFMAFYSNMPKYVSAYSNYIIFAFLIFLFAIVIIVGKK